MIETGLGEPVAAMQSRLQPGAPQGCRLYWRIFRNGIVYVNWTGQLQSVTLPPDRHYLDADGNPVTAITVPDMTGTFVKTTR